ncbi:MAG: Slp family lipoprotein [Gammaproteobacteria bacterium]|nr:Slp family lipoprotein [Gammaproteobacteria bacterium]
MIIKLSLLIFIALQISCATAPKFDTKNIELSLTPEQVVNDTVSTRGKTILWGGTILDIRNLKNETQIEILAYPLNTYHRPLTGKKPLGRFILLQTGYLEPASYAQGEKLTVIGKVSGTRSGKVGDTQYTYALIKAQQLHLWPDDSESTTRFHFGIGIQM